MSRKAPPPKKRHTKPCKFFQLDRCPHPADVCNFAHVIASPSDRDSSIYRYYPGYYTQDALCGYSYTPKVPLLESLNITSAGSDLRLDTKNCGRTNFDTDSPDSITTGSTSMSTLDLDEAVITDDPQYHEHLHSYQSQVYIEDNSPVIHVPPFHAFNGPPTPPYGYDNLYMSRKPLDPFKQRNTKSSTKQKILKYKTKPCRFFPTEKGCPKGSSCAFIHDESRHQPPSPVKESNPKENSRKNYFPVPWRVIGGGVRVGIDTEGSTTTSSCPVQVDPPSKSDNGSSSTKVTSRKRSNSNPLAPSPHSMQFKMEHLFSAESPGVL